MLTLGIETSCDETAVALVENSRVLSGGISSSVHLHAQYGGVIPEIASRYHTEYIYPVMKEALAGAGKDIRDVALVSVTDRPGLPGCLLVGKAFAEAISFAGDIPIVRVDHVMAHVISCFIDENERVPDISDKFPFLGVVVSGGHTNMYLFRSLSDAELLGRTKDDAIGEAFDKVSKILDMGYPGGPIVEKAAERYAEGRSTINEIKFPRALLKDGKDLDFSFSGIKTAVLYYWREAVSSQEEKERVAYSFQEAVIDVVEKKILRAMKACGVKRLAVGGGVINNKVLRTRISSACSRKGYELYLPEPGFCTDNAAMVAVLGELLFSARK
ncbi:MAG: tRNA (adenosine(37)-N6)-threonylcarbamoyltransferase complex transferase subunit TsaD [Candidatus Omnitrophota bacterium]|nr:tRNA (adenosine(37)-N6)-threonylcarbamoyltransferase complex transferase subunit TsaD [Candidatus Omnitrophota bacterium]